MTVRHDEAAARTERARAIGLFRYQLIREAADPALSPKARGRLVRQIAAKQHLDPSGRAVRISRDTLDRWIRAWRAGGFDALVPSPRQSSPRLPVEVVESDPPRRLVTRVTNDIDAILELFASGAFNAVVDLVKLLGIVIVMVSLDRPLRPRRRRGRGAGRQRADRAAAVRLSLYLCFSDAPRPRRRSAGRAGVRAF